MARVLLALLLTVALGTPALAQGDDLDDALFGGGETSAPSHDTPSDDALFGGGLVTDLADDPDANPADALLVNEGVAIGGRFRLAAELNLDPSAGDDDEVVSAGLTELSSRIFLDARPSSDLRVFVEGALGYDTETGLEAELLELFADVDLFDTVFLRAGKQTVNWGVGTFFSPANLINLDDVDPEDPDADLAGPVALKAQLPIDRSNLSGYLVLDDLDDGDPIALAARYEFLLSGVEVTVGGVWQPDSPWAVMATGSGGVDLGSLGSLSLYGEAVLEGDSDKRFVVEDPESPLGVRAAEADALYGSFTVGGRYGWTSEDERTTVSFSAQYYLNGLGYDDPSVLTDDPAAVGALLAAGEIGAGDLTGRGKHYLAANLSAPDVAGTDLSPSLFWLGNLSDGSGLLTATLAYVGIDEVTPSLSYRYGYGSEGAEYSPDGESHRVTLGVVIDVSF